MKKILTILILNFFIATANASLKEILEGGELGQNCSSDYQCESLCCSQSTGACSPHDPTGELPMFCSKSPGESCVSSEFCRMQPVVVCKIVKAGYNPDGTLACILKCPSVLRSGICSNQICEAPLQPPIPVFDPNDCSKAVDP